MTTSGDRLGHYELIELIGRGGMGEVWRARDTRRHREVALKLLPTEYVDRPQFRARFEREARVTAGLSSPHVVPLHDVGEIDGRLFLDMRLVPGGSLADDLAASPGGLAPDRVLALLSQVAEALDAAHAAGLVHRDVKPSNVLLDGPWCYLADFGIAKVVDETSGLTETGQVLGTSAYAAPELYLTGEVTPATDVYALGCVLHEMLTGRKAFAATTALAAMHAHVFGPLPEPGAVRADLAPFDPVVARALAREPAERHPSASALVEEATRAHAGGSAPPPPDPPPPTSSADAGPPLAEPAEDAEPARDASTRPSRRRVRPALLLGAALALVVALAATVALVRGTDPGPAGTAGLEPAPSSRPTFRLLPATFENGNGVVVGPDGRRAYVSDAATRDVAVVELDGGTVVDRLPARFGAAAMDLSPDGRTLAVVNRGFDEGTGFGISLIDLATRVSTTVERPVRPGRVLFAPDSRSVYVGDRGTDDAPGRTVAQVDVRTGALLRTVPVDLRPDGLALSPDRTTLYVACSGDPEGSGDGAIEVVPLDGSPPRRIEAARSPFALAVLRDGLLQVVTDGGGPPRNGIDVVDPRTGATRTRTEPSLRYPFDLTPMPDGRTLAVVQFTEKTPPESAFTLVDGDTGAVRATVALPPGFADGALTPDGRRAYVVSDTALGVVDLAG